ncbi:zf-TFIIB domain-containing protein [Litorimonas sp. RW-G-Af-16]|uniref:TFIIB-type zinc ribbon-containing protein n=1 Tax=Litorimonas sp. RW-G-Af-16 TaxID=3241168 RepID=UPI00390C882D
MRNCPVDDFTLATETYEGVTIDKCPHCQGVWLDAGELEAIQERVEVDHSAALARPENTIAGAYAVAKAKSEGSLSCVTCNTGLVKREYGFASQIVIDNCPKGHGIWLDAGELQKLEQFFEREQEIADEVEDEIWADLKPKGISGFFKDLFGAIKD